jgi:hypothetical protein
VLCLKDITTGFGIVVALAPSSMVRRMVLRWHVMAPFDSVEPGVECRMHDVDALHSRRHHNLLVAQLVGGHLKRGDLVADRVKAFQLFIHGVELLHDGSEHGVGGGVGT